MRIGSILPTLSIDAITVGQMKLRRRKGEILMLLTREQFREIAERERLCEGQAPGPWTGQCEIFDRNRKELLMGPGSGIKHVPVGRFIAASKADVPLLLSHINTLWWMERFCPWVWVYRAGSRLWARIVRRRRAT